jgi:hypothetical protein
MIGPWDTPYEWLQDNVRGWNEYRLRRELLALARRTPSEVLLREYQSEMEREAKLMKEEDNSRVLGEIGS